MARSRSESVFDRIVGHGVRVAVIPWLLWVLTVLVVTVAGCKLGSFADFLGNNNNNSSGGGGSSGLTLNFSTPVDVSGSSSLTRNANVKEYNYQIDSSNNLYLVYEETNSAGGDLQIKYATKPAGGSWSAPVQLSAGTVTAAVAAGSVRMGVNPTNGHVYVVWQQGLISSSASQVFFTTNFSGSFTTATVLSTTASQPAQTPGIRVDAGDDAHILWTVNVLPRSIVYVGVFNGVPDANPSVVTAQSGHTSDDAVLDPDAIGLIPGSGAQIVSLPYIATVNNIPITLYTERPAGSGQTFGGITDISVESSGMHASGSVNTLPRSCFDSAGDLEVIWAHTDAGGAKNVGGNGRPSGSAFQAESGLLTTASVGDSSNTTPPADGNGHPILDTSGGLELVYENTSAETSGSYSHGYFPVGSANSSTAISILDTTTQLNLPHLIRSSLDGFTDLHTAFPVEDSSGNRILFYDHRTTGASGVFDASPLMLSAAGVDSRLASLQVTSAGRGFVLYDAATLPAVSIAVHETSDTRSGPLQLSTDSNPNTAVGVRVDTNGTAHAIWLDTFNSTQNDIMYSEGS